MRLCAAGRTARRILSGDGRHAPVPVLLALLLVLLCAEPLSAASLGDDTAKVIARVLKAKAPRVVLGRELPLDARDLPAFYKRRGFRPAWVENDVVTPLARELLNALRDSSHHGLCLDDYLLEPLAVLLRQVELTRRAGLLGQPEDLARLDLLLSEAFLRLTRDLESGRVDGDFHGRYPSSPRFDLAPLYGEILRQQSLGPLLERLLPDEPGYLRLLAALGRYRNLAVHGGWPSIPPGPTLAAGQSDPRLPLLRQRLRLAGDLTPGGEAGELFDAATEAALLSFQRRHGLPGDGRLGPATLEELNVPVERRLLQLELNLERLRWLPRATQKRQVRVNIAAFSLEALLNGVPVLTMPVVVGTAYRQTPIFSSRIGRLEFAPTWTVPRTILAEDKLPKIRRDPNYLAEHHYDILLQRDGELVPIDPAEIDWRRVSAANFPGLLRQRPGPWNPLGRVKFLFPNPHDVYLHDTSDPQLFQRESRTFSSGCIRVARPVDLALFALEGEKGWDRQRILAAMNRRETQLVELAQPLPVHIVYATAWVDPSGEVQFRRDFYLRDEDLARALAQLTAQRSAGLPLPNPFSK